MFFPTDNYTLPTSQTNMLAEYGISTSDLHHIWPHNSSRNLRTAYYTLNTNASTYYALQRYGLICNITKHTNTRPVIHADSVKVRSYDIEGHTLKEYLDNQNIYYDNAEVYECSVSIVLVTAGHTYIKNAIEQEQLTTYPKQAQYLKDILYKTIPGVHHVYIAETLNEHYSKQVHIFTTSVSTAFLEAVMLLYPTLVGDIPLETLTPENEELNSLPEVVTSEYIEDESIDKTTKIRAYLKKYLQKINILLEYHANVQYIEHTISDLWDTLEENMQKIMMYVNIKNAKDTFIANTLTQYKETITDGYQRKCTYLTNEIESVTRSLADYKLELLKLQRKIAYIEADTQIKENINTFFETLEDFKKSITITDYAPTYIDIAVTTELTNYEEDEMQICYNNHNSTHCSNLQYFSSDPTIQETLRQILIDIFVNKKYRIKINQNYRVRLTDDLYVINPNNARAIDQQLNQNTYLVNPHIGYHACWSQARVEIIDSLNNFDYIRAWTQLIYATGNLTATDLVVNRTLIKSLKTNSHLKTIRDVETNELYSIEDLLEKYKK